MANVNTCTVSGNLTRDPELRSLPSGTSVANIGIAVNRRYKDENAEDGYAEEVSYFDISVFGKFAELVARKLRKGDSAVVQGRLKQSRWETEDGNRSRVEIIADQIDSDGFFRSKEEDATTTTGDAAPSDTPATPPADDDIPF